MNITLNNLDNESLELHLAEIIGSPNVIGEWEYSFLFDVKKQGEPDIKGSRHHMSSINVLAKYNKDNKLEVIDIENDSEYLITRDEQLELVDNYNKDDINNIVLSKVKAFLERRITNEN